jgi:tetratricopeptide (TPR) repeat protein
LGLIALVLATFGRLVGFGFAEWDDRGTIFDNPALRSVSVDTIVKAWTEPHMAIFIPVTHTVWALIAAAAGHATADGYVISPVPFRVLSLALHAASTLLVFDLVRRILRARSGTLAASLLGTAIFAVHPIQVEAVAWISGQKDLLAGFFVLATLTVATRAAEGEPRKGVWTLTMMVLGVLAMLSKPQAVVVLPMIVVVLRARDVSWRRAIAVTVPLLLPAIVVGVIGRSVQPATVVPDVPIVWRPIVALDALGWYAAKLVAPVGLTIDYGHTPQLALASSWTYVIAGAMAFAIAAAWLLRRQQPLLAAGLAIAAIGPLPVLGLVKFSFQYYSTVTDHYLYTGMFGVALAVAAVHRQIPRPAARVIAFAIIVPLAALTWRQAELWKDTNSLFGHNLAVNPNSLGANRVLAFAASQRGDDEAAVRYLDVALARYPKDAMANFNLANALVRLNRLPESLPAFDRAIEAEPTVANVRHNYAITLAKLGRLEEAEQQLKKAVALDLKSVASMQALAKVQAMRAAQTATQPATQP